jgi:hypothetical protein
MGGELAKPVEFVIANIREVKGNIMENFEGLTPQFMPIKFPTGGSTVFELDEEPVKEIDGVIVDHYAIRLLFLREIGEVKRPPDCVSQNGLTGSGLCEEKLACICADCEYNKWGSFKEFIKESDDTNKKACREKHRIFVLRSGDLLPILLTIPITSKDNFANYMTKIASKGKSYKTIITGITLEKAKSKGNLDFAKATFQKIGDIPDEKLKDMLMLSEYLKPYTRNKPIDTSEVPEEDTEKEPF